MDESSEDSSNFVEFYDISFTYRAPTTTCCLATSNSSWEYDVTPSCWNRLVFAKSETGVEEGEGRGERGGGRGFSLEIYRWVLRRIR